MRRSLEKKERKKLREMDGQRRKKGKRKKERKKI